MTKITLGITRNTGLKNAVTYTIVTGCRTKINKLQLFSVFMLISRLYKSDC